MWCTGLFYKVFNQCRFLIKNLCPPLVEWCGNITYHSGITFSNTESTWGIRESPGTSFEPRIAVQSNIYCRITATSKSSANQSKRCTGSTQQRMDAAARRLARRQRCRPLDIALCIASNIPTAPAEPLSHRGRSHSRRSRSGRGVRCRSRAIRGYGK